MRTAKKLAASKKQTENATTTAKTNSDFEMDDYELLLARHQLIQQQLQKVKGKIDLFSFFLANILSIIWISLVLNFKL